MSYADLADSVRRMAAKLRQLGVRPGSVVAVRARPELEAVLIIALLHEGAVSLHASEAILAAHGDQVDYLVGEVMGSSRTRARVITIDAAFLMALGAVNSRIDPQPLDDAAPCRVVFSSGTTGSPKGVEFTVSSLLSRTSSARANWMPIDPFMCLLGLDTVSGFQTFMWSMLHGATYLVPGDGEANRRLIDRFGVRSIKTSPARLENLVDAVDAADDATPLALDHVGVAGSLLSPLLGRRCELALGTSPTYLYGSTEVGTVTRGRFNPDKPAVVGTVVDDAELQIIDDDGRDVSSASQQGVIRYRSASTPRAYWRASAEANASFRDGWFYPGDRGALTVDGGLIISGRSDDVVNAGGAKFNLAELDLWMLEIELFADCASFQYRDTDGTTRVGLAFVSRTSVSPEIVLERIRSMLPNLEVRKLFRIDTIPRNQLGKVNRAALTALIGTS
jgi:acyl-coenzyme A synthetase/AMP-(fatty) acid ligase